MSQAQAIAFEESLAGVEAALETLQTWAEASEEGTLTGEVSCLLFKGTGGRGLIKFKR